MRAEFDETPLPLPIEGLCAVLLSGFGQTFAAAAVFTMFDNCGPGYIHDNSLSGHYGDRHFEGLPFASAAIYPLRIRKRQAAGVTR